MKTCKNCNIKKDLVCFSRNIKAKDKLQSNCKTCQKQYDKIYRSCNKEKIAEYHKEYKRANSQEHRSRQKLPENKIKKAMHAKTYYKKHRKKIIQKVKQYADSNKAAISLKQKKHYDKNKEEYSHKFKIYRQENKAKINQYLTNRKRIDPQFKLIGKLRIRLHTVLKGKQKKVSTINDTGISLSVLIVYLNLDCLDKYGEPYTGNECKYHIDHIKPLSSFDLTDRIQLLEAINWRNLQILTIKENLSKGAKR